jgi:hypothetical protein
MKIIIEAQSGEVFEIVGKDISIKFLNDSGKGKIRTESKAETTVSKETLGPSDDIGKKEKSKARYRANREKISAERKEQEMKERSAAYYRANKEKILAKRRERSKKNGAAKKVAPANKEENPPAPVKERAPVPERPPQRRVAGQWRR